MSSDSKEFQVCIKCRNIIENEGEWGHCEHELIQMRAMQTEGGIGIECLEAGCHFNDIPISSAMLSQTLNAHARSHCRDENPDDVFNQTMMTLGSM